MKTLLLGISFILSTLPAFAQTKPTLLLKMEKEAAQHLHALKSLQGKAANAQTQVQTQAQTQGQTQGQTPAHLQEQIAYDEWFLAHQSEFELLELDVFNRWKGLISNVAKAELSAMKRLGTAKIVLSPERNRKEISFTLASAREHLSQINSNAKITAPLLESLEFELQVFAEKMTANLNSNLQDPGYTYLLSYVNRNHHAELMLTVSIPNEDTLFNYREALGTPLSQSTLSERIAQQLISQKKLTISGKPADALLRYASFLPAGSVPQALAGMLYLDLESALRLPFSPFRKLNVDEPSVSVALGENEIFTLNRNSEIREMASKQVIRSPHPLMKLLQLDRGRLYAIDSYGRVYSYSISNQSWDQGLATDGLSVSVFADTVYSLSMGRLFYHPVFGKIWQPLGLPEPATRSHLVKTFANSEGAFVMDTDGRIYRMLDLNHGELLATFPGKADSVIQFSALGSDAIYVLTQSGDLFCHEDHLWKQVAQWNEEVPLTGLSVTRNRVCVSTNDAQIYCL